MFASNQLHSQFHCQLSHRQSNRQQRLSHIGSEHCGDTGTRGGVFYGFYRDEPRPRFEDECKSTPHLSSVDADFEGIRLATRIGIHEVSLTIGRDLVDLSYDYDAEKEGERGYQRDAQNYS
jgi:hypothetical protein